MYRKDRIRKLFSLLWRFLYSSPLRVEIRKSGAMPPLPHIHLCRTQGQSPKTSYYVTWCWGVFSVCILPVVYVVCCTDGRLHSCSRTVFGLFLLFAVIFSRLCARGVSSDVYVHVVPYGWVWLTCVSLEEYRVSSTRKEYDMKLFM